MANDNKAKFKFDISKIDPSDIRVLLVGVFLLLVPIAIFLFSLGSGSDDGFSGRNAKDRLVGRKGGFSFNEQKSFGVAMNGPTGPKSIYESKTADKQWAAAAQAAMSNPRRLPTGLGLSPFGRMVLEADMDPDLRMANVFWENGHLEEAVALNKKILDRGSTNPAINFTASSNLCALYEKLGMKEELAKEFKRMIDLMEQLPDMGKGFQVSLKPGLQALAKIKGLMPKLGLDAKFQSALRGSLAENGLSGKLSPGEVMTQMQTDLDMIPGLESFK